MILFHLIHRFQKYIYYQGLCYLMTTNNKKRERRIIVDISGDVLRAAMALRAISEGESGAPTSLTAIVKAAVLAEFKRVEEDENK